MSDPQLVERAPADEIAPPALFNLLGIPDESRPSERTRLLLQQLDHADYLAGPAWHDALDVLGDATLKRVGATWLSRPALSRAFEDRLRTEVDQLATRFLNIPPPDRISRWNDLAQRSRFWPSLRSRLALLEPGIALGPAPPECTGDHRVTTLVQSIVRLFPLDASSRGGAIGEVLGSMIDEPQAWEEAAHRLSRDRPDISLLVPEFLAAVTTLCDREREEILRYEARNRETAEAAQWESQNLGYYLDLLRGKRAYYWLIGIFGGIPLLVLAIAAVFDFVAPSALKQSPENLYPTNGTLNETRIDPRGRAEQALRGKTVPPPVDSGSDPFE